MLREKQTIDVPELGMKFVADSPSGWREPTEEESEEVKNG